MTTQKLIEANRANAQLSTGPKTPEGKARVALNRLSHGLAGRTVLLSSEDQHAYDLVFARLQIDHMPATEAERALVRSIADAQWRLRRIAAWESALIEEALEGDLSNPSRLMTMFSRSGDPSEALAKLARYEASVRRAWHNALKELRLQKSARHRALTVEASTTRLDQEPMRKLVTGICRELNIPSPFKSRDGGSNPIPAEPASPQPLPAGPPPPETARPAAPAV